MGKKLMKEFGREMGGWARAGDRAGGEEERKAHLVGPGGHGRAAVLHLGLEGDLVELDELGGGLLEVALGIAEEAADRRGRHGDEHLAQLQHVAILIGEFHLKLGGDKSRGRVRAVLT